MDVRASLTYYLFLSMCIVSHMRCNQSQISLTATEKLLQHIHSKISTGWPIDEKVVRQYVQKGGTLNVRFSGESFKKAPLIYWMLYNECKYRDIEICLENGMSLNASWQKFPTPFHYAAALRKWQHSYLLINEEMANKRDEVGITPLLLVTAGCYDDRVRNKLVKRLLDAKARPNDTDDVCGVSPTWCAALFHDASTIKLLGDYGACNISVDLRRNSANTKGLRASQAVLLPATFFKMGDDKDLTRSLHTLIKKRRYTKDGSQRSALTHRYLIDMPLSIAQANIPNSTYHTGMQQ